MSSSQKLKVIVLLVGLLLFTTITGYFIWWSLPITITRTSDIRFGNELIREIEQYKNGHKLPETNDWVTFRLLGFEDHKDYFIPQYQKIDNSNYELVFVEGFDGPYLLWNSKDRQWKIAQPTPPINNRVDQVLNLVEGQKIVKAQIKLIDSLSSGRRHISLVPILDDTAKNIYLVKVAEDNGTNMVTYLNFLIDANKMTILNPSGKLEGQ